MCRKPKCRLSRVAPSVTHVVILVGTAVFYYESARNAMITIGF